MDMLYICVEDVFAVTIGFEADIHNLLIIYGAVRVMKIITSRYNQWMPTVASLWVIIKTGSLHWMQLWVCVYIQLAKIEQQMFNKNIEMLRVDFNTVIHIN